jgi:hypothetical protein
LKEQVLVIEELLVTFFAYLCDYIHFYTGFQAILLKMRHKRLIGSGLAKIKLFNASKMSKDT